MFLAKQLAIICTEFAAWEWLRTTGIVVTAVTTNWPVQLMYAVVEHGTCINKYLGDTNMADFQNEIQLPIQFAFALNSL